jgi:hypothetical protein
MKERQTKLILIAGVLSGAAISFTEYIIHGIFMHPVYAEWATKGVMEMTGKPFGIIHYAFQSLLGFPMVYLYSLASRSLNRSFASTIVIGLLAGTFCLSITTALYTFYNLGTIIPLVISVDKLLECIICCVIASLFLNRQSA